jgi:hypothetical protein
MALDYDVYDPMEVIPEFTADVGIKKGEKVDYAIMRDGQPIILMECKWCGMNLDNAHASQLYRYFSVTSARIAVLTNGLIYRFFTDLENQNQMDSKPFLEINMLELHEPLITELKKLTKPNFNIDELIPAAAELKYTREIKLILGQQLQKPSDDFVKFFASRVHSGRMTQNVLAQFEGITRRAFKQFISEEINKRLESVLDKEQAYVDSEEIPQPEENENSDLTRFRSAKQKEDERIETTPEELEGFAIVRAILKETVDLERVFFRDTRSYFGILLDDNNRRVICRLYFDSSQKYISLFDNEERKEDKNPIDEISQINNYADRLKATVIGYDRP